MKLSANYLRFVRLIGLPLLAIISSIAAYPHTVLADQQLVLRPSMITNEDILGPDTTGLVDEQTTVGDPALNTGLRPSSPFFSGWAAWTYPMHYFIDLGATYKVTRVYIYNETGGGQFVLSTGLPFSWKDQQCNLTGYRSWNQFPRVLTTRYIRLTLLHPISMSELLIYADGAGVPTKPRILNLPIRPVRERPTMDQFIGTNAFIDDPTDKLADSVGYVREYHNWSWDTEGLDHLERFQPSGAAGGNSWFFDDYYGKLNAAGVTVAPAVQGNDTIYFPGSKGSDKPVADGDDPESPRSYLIHAKHLFQYAARYGSTTVPQSEVTLAPDQPKRTGEHLLRYIENWNEPDGTWSGRSGYFTPYELAAMCSADYDGDQRRLGAGAGVHTADPAMRLVLSGLSRDRLDYLMSMKLWADYHRGGDFPADVINFHHYSSDAGDAGGFKTTGISPEADNLESRFAAIVKWCHSNIPGREVWVTEFGYDTNQASPLHAPAIGTYSAEEVQGIWLLRSYLALAAAGVDRASMYMFRDTGPSTDGGVFATSGMVTQKGEWAPKPSYFYIATLKNRLKGMRFDSDISTAADEKSNVCVYRFKGAKVVADVVWCTTSTGSVVDNISVPVSSSSTVSQIDFAAGNMTGQLTTLTAQNGVAIVTAYEKPLIVVEALR